MKNSYVKVIKSLILLLVVLTLVGCQKNKQTAQPNYSELVISTTEPLSFSGVVRSQQKQYLNFNAQMGETIRLAKRNQEQLAKGELLATYYSLEVKNSLIEQELVVSTSQQERLELEKTPLENSERIAELINQEQLAKDKIATLESYGLAKIYGEFAGTLKLDNTINYENGGAICELVSTDQLVEMSVTEYDLDKLEVGQDLDLTKVNSGEVMTGKIVEIENLPEDTVSKVSSYKVKVNVSETLPVGSHIQLFLAMNEIKLPNSAVKVEDDQYYVYKIVGKKAVKTLVQVQKKANYLLIISGLKENERIIKEVAKISEKEVVLTDD